MSRAARARWAISFADLCLLLLGFFVLLQASQATREESFAGLATYFGELRAPHRADLPAERLFLPGEALLTDTGRVELVKAARAFSSDDSLVRIQSLGLATGEARFDAWDLSAARLGAVARALVSAGIAPDRIRIAGLAEADHMRDAARQSGQTIRLAEAPRPAD